MTANGTRRYPIRYAAQRWSDGKWFYGGLFVIGLVLIAFNVYSKRPIINFVPVTVLCGAILVAFWLMQKFSYLEIADDGLRVRYGLRHMELPYSALASVRRQPLEVAFQRAESRRFVTRYVRRLGREPAVYIRIDRRKPDLVESADRQLGLALLRTGRSIWPENGLLPVVMQHARLHQMSRTDKAAMYRRLGARAGTPPSCHYTTSEITPALLELATIARQALSVRAVVDGAEGEEGVVVVAPNGPA